jgi:hypothetical protein
MTDRPMDSARERSVANAWVVDEVLRAVKDIRYGSVEITIHDSRVVQIERKEKVRPGGGP